MTSLRARLFALVAAVTMLVWAGAAAWTSLSTRAEVERVLDRRLVEAARMVASLDIPVGGAPRRVEPSSYERQLSCQIWSLTGRLVGQSAGAPQAPLAQGASGFSERRVGAEDWRVYTHVDEARGIRVMVGDNLQVRQRLVTDMMLGLLLPALVGLIALAALLWVGIASGLEPLARLARDLKRRSSDSLASLELERTPAELSPVVTAMNDLLAQLESARRAERDFVANAAHELQTPLAGLKTQAEVARRAREPAMRDHALAQITHSVDRTSRLVRQLLDLARQEGRRGLGSSRTIPLCPVLEEVLHDYAPVAHSQGMTIEIAPDCSELRLAIDPGALRLALGNLVENALHHGSAGGFVRIECDHRDGLELRVVDGGAGIPENDRARLLRRFERGAGVTAQGSGLGLSIAEAAIAAAGGVLELRGADPSGLIAALRFPDRKHAGGENSPRGDASPEHVSGDHEDE